jgi:carbon-monoxide dehydrogenase small subunit
MTSAHTVRISCTLNGKSVSDDIAPQQLLVHWLRDRHGLQGCRVACQRGVCGACTVLINEEPVASCSAFAFQADGHSITTIEGMSTAAATAGERPALHAIQQSFLDHGAFQCGYCTSGMVMLTAAMLLDTPRPDEATVREWISSNVCRCTGYGQILEAVHDAAQRCQSSVTKS